MNRFIRLLVGVAAVVVCLAVFLPSAGRAQEWFTIEQVGPQRFHIESEVEGKASALVTGGPGPQVVTRQEDGYTTVDARIPVGGKLTLTIGNHGLTIWMEAPDYWEWEEY